MKNFSLKQFVLVWVLASLVLVAVAAYTMSRPIVGPQYVWTGCPASAEQIAREIGGQPEEWEYYNGVWMLPAREHRAYVIVPPQFGTTYAKVVTYKGAVSYEAEMTQVLGQATRIVTELRYTCK
jgi:hypothetical protein